MTKEALDSAYAPSDAQIAAARAAGCVAWFGYFKFGNDGIYNGWSDDDFRRVLAGGLQTGAYWSGWADPVLVRARAARLGIRARLDVEGELRPDGDWVQGALDAAASGLYGNWPVMTGRRAIDYVVAAYPISGDPGGESWPSWLTRPTGGPCGWQWAGSHGFAGITVDSNWLDDGFFAFAPAGTSLGGLDVITDPTQTAQLKAAADYANLTAALLEGDNKPAGAPYPPVRNILQDILAAVKVLPGGQAALDAIADVKATVQADHAAVLAALSSDTAASVVELKAALNDLKIIGGGLTPDQDAALQAAEKAATAVQEQLAAGLKLDIPLGAVDIKGSVKA